METTAGATVPAPGSVAATPVDVRSLLPDSLIHRIVDVRRAAAASPDTLLSRLRILRNYQAPLVPTRDEVLALIRTSGGIIALTALLRQAVEDANAAHVAARFVEAGDDSIRQAHETLDAELSNPPPPPEEVVEGAIRHLFNRYGSRVSGTPNTLAVVLGPITLRSGVGRDVVLGQFLATVDFRHVILSGPGTWLTVRALQPHPHTVHGAEAVHPHVRGGRLCLGEGAGTVDKCMKAGLVLDAFVAIETILSTYNPASPHYRLDNWDGVFYTCRLCNRTDVPEAEASRDPDGTAACSRCSVEVFTRYGGTSRVLRPRDRTILYQGVHYATANSMTTVRGVAVPAGAAVVMCGSPDGTPVYGDIARMSVCDFTGLAGEVIGALGDTLVSHSPWDLIRLPSGLLVRVDALGIPLPTLSAENSHERGSIELRWPAHWECPSGQHPGRFIPASGTPAA